MLTFKNVAVDQSQQKHRADFIKVLDAAVKGNAALSGTPHLFMIGSWQTGDFGHIYAAIVSTMLSDNPRACAIIILNATGDITGILNDIKFALADLCERNQRAVVVMHTSIVTRDNGIKVLSLAGKDSQPPLLLNGAIALCPYDATFMAGDIIRAMRPGQPMTSVWAELARDGSSDQSKAYAGAVEAFTKLYVERFGVSKGREKFVCLWSRTSGMRAASRPTGGANPQYDSSEESNHQLCVAINQRIGDLKCIFIVGADGFAQKTRDLPYVFDLGAFWKKLQGVMGRFQENGFFDYMTAVYDCDVVHVGMKSGGMDVLGMWGQKVVFVDTIKSPQPTQERVGAWSNQAMLCPVPVDRLPTPTGKAIDDLREGNSRAIGTSVSKGQWEKIDAKTGALADGYTPQGLAVVVDAVAKMF